MMLWMLMIMLMASTMDDVDHTKTGAVGTVNCDTVRCSVYFESKPICDTSAPVAKHKQTVLGRKIHNHIN